MPLERVVCLTWWQVRNLYLEPAQREAAAQKAELSGQSAISKADFMEAYRAKRPDATEKQCKQAWRNYQRGGLK